MLFQGVLRKMSTVFDQPIHYFWQLGEDRLHVNQLLGKRLEIQFIGQQCLNCGNERPIFRQGFCRSCFFEIPSAGDWIMRPELSTAHLDKEDRDLAYEKKVQLQPHIVYLANSSHVKVGVTRKSQVPTRWIDQGAHQAMAILEVPNRYLAGITEVALKEQVSDKTSWQKMLTQKEETADLQALYQEVKSLFPEEVKEYAVDHPEQWNLHFPVQKTPEKVKSLKLEKEQQFAGRLSGIKGQYLIFEDNRVLNVRSNEGTVIGLNIFNS